MNSRERVIRTLRHEEVDRVPRNLWALQGVLTDRKQEYDEVSERFPDDFTGPGLVYGNGRRCKGQPGVVGHYTDAWGCVWHVGKPGVIGEVKEFPLADWSALKSYELPWEILDEADLSNVNSTCSKADKFVLAGTDVRPFERMQFLRGTENLYMDLGYGENEVYELRDRLHEYYLKNIKMLADTDVDGVSFMDDWGSQNSLLISPNMWREFFKPLYKDYCDILHEKGKFVFFHSDGNIESIYPDLIEVGINAVNSQLFCMDIEKLGKECSGKITFWGEIDRQYTLPFGTEEDVRAAVRKVASSLMSKKRTGIIAQCEWGNTDPKENIIAVFDEWNKF